MREADTDGVRALMLSAGMMFGAYQAGAWKVLSRAFRPDLVVGVSSGALNAWAIAGGCPPGELAAMWLDPALRSMLRFRPGLGIFDPQPLLEVAERLHTLFRPRVDIAITVTELPGFRPRLFVNREITPRHLAASCAVLFGFPPVLIGGRLYTDGGVLAALPLWAAGLLGVRRALVINAMPELPFLPGRIFLRALRRLAPALPRPPATAEFLTVKPARPLGSLGDLILWKRQNAEGWIEQGQNDAAAVLPRLEEWQAAQ